jgi:hypothetical protein
MSLLSEHAEMMCLAALCLFFLLYMHWWQQRQGQAGRGGTFMELFGHRHRSHYLQPVLVKPDDGDEETVGAKTIVRPRRPWYHASVHYVGVRFDKWQSRHELCPKPEIHRAIQHIHPGYCP